MRGRYYFCTRQQGVRYRPRILYFACITFLVTGTEACASEGWTYAYSRSSCVIITNCWKSPNSTYLVSQASRAGRNMVGNWGHALNQRGQAGYHRGRVGLSHRPPVWFAFRLPVSFAGLLTDCEPANITRAYGRAVSTGEGHPTKIYFTRCAPYWCE